MAVFHSDCLYFEYLIPGMIGYDPNHLEYGRCRICPPTPTGEYRAELADWPIVNGLELFLCGLVDRLGPISCDCRRSCTSGVVPPPPNDFLLTENTVGTNYVLTETGDRIILEAP